MQNKTLQTKRALRTALLVLLLSAAGMGKGYAYDFSSVCSTGQTLYYNIIDATNCYVEVVAPSYSLGSPSWVDYVEPTGNLVLPNNVVYNETTYSVTSIGLCAFQYCEGITSVNIPNSVTAIGDWAFSQCLGLNDSLVLPNSIVSIGNYAFNECSGLVGSLEIPNSVISIGEGAFLGCYGFTGSLILSNSLTSINNNTFSFCTGFSGSLIIPDSVITIGEWAFGECQSFNNLVLPNSVTSIGDFAFRSWYELTNIIIPNSLTTIGDRVFENCFGLETVVALCTIPPILGYLPFYCSNLIVCCGSKDAYMASDWASYFDIIEEDCTPHEVTIDEGGMTGGSVSTTVNSTTMGEEVQLTITPDEGMYLASLMVCNVNNPEQTVSVYPIGKTSSLYGFIMPPFDVVVTAVFAPINAVGENNSIAANVYPNPTNGQIKIKAEGLKHITISNMQGLMIYESEANGREFDFDFSQQGAGVYFIRIESLEGVNVKKIVVTK